MLLLCMTLLLMALLSESFRLRREADTWMSRPVLVPVLVSAADRVLQATICLSLEHQLSSHLHLAAG